jgi:hypothetical protein
MSLCPLNEFPIMTIGMRTYIKRLSFIKKSMLDLYDILPEYRTKLPKVRLLAGFVVGCTHEMWNNAYRRRMYPWRRPNAIGISGK